MATHAEGAAGAAKGVQFVDEDDGRRSLPRLLEQVSHARRADADEHFDELRAGDGEERHARLAGHRAREHRFPGPGRADQQHALGHASAEATIVLRAFEEADNLLQFLLGFIDTGHVVEGQLGIGLDIDLGFALADGEEPAA